MSRSSKKADACNIGARETAFEVLLRVERGGAFASVLLQHEEQRLADPREAALAHELVLGVLRQQALLDAVLSRAASRLPARMDPDVRVASRMGIYSLLFLDRVPAFAAVDRTVALLGRRGRRRAAGFANAVLRAVAREGRSWLPPDPRPGDVAAAAVRYSHPSWWVERMVRRIGWSPTLELLRANNRPAATVLRANPRRTESGELARRLADEGMAAEPCRFAPGALRVRSGGIRESRALREGLVWVQDEASQLVPLMFAGTALGPRVGDLCAAPGGKSMQLAERLMERGAVIAVDRHRGRLRRLVRNARRLGFPTVLPLNADMAGAAPPLRPVFDQILVDAPCSGTGTLRRHPEIRWRLQERQLKLLARQQSRLLDNAARLLLPGGSLVYSVCSEEPEEGEEVVERFLAERSAFRLADPRSALPPAVAGLVDSRGLLRTTPRVEGLDGFFAALLVRDCAEVSVKR